ncbi:MAG: carboxypeptidase regulatory-like domain-containing protein [Actinobacteria bacterium]|nr:carboxypeptidase regulatory-like domain-containing protein [Actinomycetota bacterium]
MQGTRGGIGRIAAMLVGLAVVLALLLAGEARAGTYQVAQCGWGVGVDLDPALVATEGTAFFLDPAGCMRAPGSGPVGMGFEGGVAPDGVPGLARARWIAPPGTSFRAAHVTWFGNPQPRNWQGLGVDVDARFDLLAYSWGGVAPARLDLPIEGHAWAFEAWLQCLLEGPVIGCTRSAASTMHLRDLIFALEDPVAPTAQLGGPLAAAGWHRGTATLELDAADTGAGVAGATATIDAAPVLALAPTCAVQLVEGELRATKMQPCPPNATQASEVDTARLADGVHTLRACATDFAGDQGCAADVALQVDNSPPTASFATAAEGQVAAMVKDRYSGSAAGTISVRRAEAEGWTDLPTAFDRDGSGTATLTAPLPDLVAGTYLFRVVARDAAGNVGSAEKRVSGSAAEVRQGAAKPKRGAPGRTPGPRDGGQGPTAQGQATRLTVRLGPSGGRSSHPARQPGAGGSGLTVDYGAAATVRGRLTDAHGAGVGGRPIAIVARPTAAVGRPPERRRVVTEPDGRFELRLAPGTSRRAVVAFHGGGGFAPAPRRSLALRVRAGVTLAAMPRSLRTGEAVTLEGRVDPGAARIPKRGKVVAIQYLERASGRWRPALDARTDAKGRFRARYRFRYVSGEARIRLRATAVPEAGWPYAEGSSPPLLLRVRG